MIYGKVGIYRCEGGFLMGGNAVLTKQKNLKKEQMKRIAYLYEIIRETGNQEVASKFYQLLKKIRDDEFTIGFCGHFSAGKSSMINELTGAQLLPSSPIPTSANVVKVKTGRAYARVYFKKQDPIEFPYPYNIKEIKAFCVDGDEVDAVEISHPSDDLPKGISVMDTPGIDSTDDAHRVATESTLHLADVILYVMDYNHVQSELNFNFTKMLKERGKKVYLVINQIDKHNEFELSFDDFKQGVLASFRNWNVEPDGIFYTSLREFDHPHNQIEELKQYVYKWMDEKEEWMKESINQSALALLKEHEQWLKKNEEEKREQLQAQLGVDSEEELTALINELVYLKKEEQAFLTKEEKFVSLFKEQMQKIVNNAILMPFETREHARLFLESEQKQFKVGLFFSKQKTEQEKEKRKNEFLHDLNEKAKAQLEWHLKDLIVKYSKEHDLYDEAFFQQVYDEQTTVSEALIHEKVMAQANVTGDYVLNYTKETQELVKRMYRKKVEAQFDYILSIFKNNQEKQIEQVQNRLKELEAQRSLIEELIDLETNRTKNINRLQQVLENDSSSREMIEKTWSTFHFKEESIQIGESNVTEEDFEETTNTDVQLIHQPKKVEEMEEVEEEVAIDVPFQVKEQLLFASEKLNRAAQTVQPITGFEIQASEMKERSKRLENNRFTVALFGAFSAGKSSFANALMGEYILPVSPNPTTATINKILPVDEENPHGTVRVKLKSVEQMEDDIRHSLKVFDLSAKSLETAIKTIQSMKVEVVEPKAKPHLSFLQAFVKGFQAVDGQLGKEIIVTIEEFQDYVAKEEKACFVEWIELHYDCPLTAQGIMLVDTPGADSINARHTGVAFEYIKNADAVLFVTYYNHAFSQADQEFLIQLGRVKDTFALDKMFFIVNAKDLASSEEELEGVLTHVSENLVSCGIRKPRMYPVSSQLALLSKLHHREELHEDQKRIYQKHTKSQTELIPAGQAFQMSGMNIFEKDFLSFTIHELTDMAISAAREDIKRTKRTLENFIETATADQSVRLLKKEETVQFQSKVTQLLESIEIETDVKSIIQEISELIYYVKQRLFLRYPEFFNMAFNPATLKDDGREIKTTLQKCLNELMETISFELAQELRATALRSENFLNKTVKQTHEMLQKQVEQMTGEWTFLPYEPTNFETPAIEETFATENEGQFKNILSLYKNGKQFFEQGGKAKMQEALQEQLDTPVTHYLDQQNKQLQVYYTQLLKEEIKQLQVELQEEVNDYVAGILAALALDVDVNQLRGAHETLTKILT